MLLFLLLLALQAVQPVALKRFEVLRVDRPDIDRLPASLRGIFADPSPSAEAVATVEEAAARAGFTPRLPKSTDKLEFGVTDSFRGEAIIHIDELNAALRDSKASDIVIPREWDGLAITIQQGSGVLADYGGFFITQAPPLTVTVPSGFPLDRFMEAIFRILGVNAMEASKLRERFAANPAAFFPIGSRYAMDIHEVRLNSGSGTILQNADKVGEMAFAWSTADRSYFITGQLTEAQVIEIANSMQ
jgi:hypothetical protein